PAKSADTSAWLDGKYSTVQLLEDVEAIRMHVNAGAGATIRDIPYASGTIGSWFSIGDAIHSYEEYVALHALPGAPTAVAWCVLPSGGVYNVGICGEKFNKPGGGVQAERVKGHPGSPEPRYLPTNGKWSFRYGNA